MNSFFLRLLTSCASLVALSCSTIPMRESASYSKDIFIPINFLESPSSVAMNVNFPPVASLRQEFEKRLGYELKNRNEAHITVITPPEASRLSSHLPFERIQQIVLENKIQQMSFKPLCVGRGRMQIDGHEESTYFIVVDAPDLIRLRGKIKEAYVAAGGRVSDFDETLYFPHITLGFTKRDLHFEDGIEKSPASCIAQLEAGSGP